MQRRGSPTTDGDTKSMHEKRSLVRACLIATLALVFSGRGAAEPDPGVNTPALESSDSVQTGARGSARHPAVVILVGALAERTDLEAVLNELLQARGVRAVIARNDRFEPARFLADSPESAVSVFIVPRADRSVRLYFRGPGGQRFLIRDLELARGLDELGRESIAQVVESSLFALLQTGAGMDREQTRTLLQAESQSELRTMPAERAPEPSTPPVHAWPRVRAWLGVGYAVRFTGEELGMLHGPRLELGATLGLPVLLRARIEADRYFSQRIRARELEATVQTTVLRASLDWGMRVGSHLAALSLGAGPELTRIDPQRLTPGVEVRSTRTNIVPVASAAIRVELALGSCSLAAGGSMDVALLRTHYDLERNGTLETIAEPWLLRPGAFILVAWAPTL